jgi:four helix bundle protein
MPELQYAHNFRDLIVYQKARQTTRAIFQFSKTFPKEATYSLIDQLRRCSRSVGAQIAEAWGKRRYQKHFISKLTDADAEQLETQHWIETAFDCGYLAEEQCKMLLSQCSEIGRMLHSMIGKPTSSAARRMTLITDH